MSNPAIAHIDLQALHYNLAQIKKLTPQAKILAMVKSNAYGHGAVPVAKSLENSIDAFGVIFVKEALALHGAGIKKTIVVLTGFFDSEELITISNLGFNTVIHNFEQLEILAKTKLIKPLQVWFKIDTGMHRLGFQPHEVLRAYKLLQDNPQVKKPLYLMTHFSDADEITHAKTLKQLACFTSVTKDLAGIKCLSNSSAILQWPEAHSEWVRPGITMYGVSPIANKTGADFGLKPVMTLTSRLIAVHQLNKGETVGYGSTWTCSEDMSVGIISIGYGDGYPRNTRPGTPILINGVRCNLIGRVAMDMTAVDLRPLPNAKVGDIATMWGNKLPIEEVAQGSDSIAYELFCRMTQRVHFEYLT